MWSNKPEIRLLLQVAYFGLTIACIIYEECRKLYFKVILTKHIAFYQFLALAIAWSTFEKWSSTSNDKQRSLIRMLRGARKSKNSQTHFTSSV